MADIRPSDIYGDKVSRDTTLPAWELKPISPPGKPREVKPVSWREMFAAVLAVVLADTTIYHGAGFAGIAVLLIGLAVLIWLGVARPRFSGGALFFAVLILCVSAKLLWCGFPSTACLGGVIVLIFGAIQGGTPLRIAELCRYPVESLLSGGLRLNEYGRFLSQRSLPSLVASLTILLPFGALLIFGTIFVLANPDLVEMIRQWLNDIGDFLSRFINWLPDIVQIPFWLLCAWCIAGLLCPQRPWSDGNDADDSITSPTTETVSPERSPYYAACRNTLLVVIALFTVYLVFEFKTLWFRRFPEGFCYSGYSHEGAAWLTAALGVSTVILSSVFRGKMLHDPRIGTLRWLAWVWSFLNIVLAVAVFNRLSIYIGFNGMTRMRVIGMLGMTAVLIGFVLVVRKIAAGKSFDWLLSRFVWTVLAMAFLNGVLPVDWLVHRYNVSRIMHGDLAPSVQISAHPCGSEGYLTFFPLLNCDDEIIREGIRAHLANKLRELESSPLRWPNDELAIVRKKPYDWTRFQAADALLHQRLDAGRYRFDDYLKNRNDADAAFKRFADYAYRWY